MEKVICFDTSIATANMGDYIIAESCDEQLKKLLTRYFVLRFPTHTPVAHWYQNSTKTSGGRYNADAKYKFIYGTNLLNANMFVPTPAWNVNLLNAKMEKNTICVGVGLGSENKKPNLYTKLLLKKLLSKEHIHSTRDEKTADFLRSIGLKAINTGCATTWGLTNEHCARIPAKKANAVVFTLTDYKKDEKNDRFLVDTLLKNYEKVYFWIQGMGDEEYLGSIADTKDIIMIPPALKAYAEVLSEDVDYVGTRLHAGIKAMQCGKRTIIIEVDNRARDMKECIDLPIIKRSELEAQLEKMICSDLVIRLNIHTEAIQSWRQQFDELK